MFENESLSFEEQTIIQAAERYVQQELANEASGHEKQLQRKNKQIYFYVY